MCSVEQHFIFDQHQLKLSPPPSPLVQRSAFCAASLRSRHIPSGHHTTCNGYPTPNMRCACLCLQCANSARTNQVSIILPLVCQMCTLHPCPNTHFVNTAIHKVYLVSTQSLHQQFASHFTTYEQSLLNGSFGHNFWLMFNYKCQVYKYNVLKGISHVMSFLNYPS